jgi:hypothetical protein
MRRAVIGPCADGIGMSLQRFSSRRRHAVGRGMRGFRQATADSATTIGETASGREIVHRPFRLPGIILRVQLGCSSSLVDADRAGHGPGVFFADRRRCGHAAARVCGSGSSATMQ